MGLNSGVISRLDSDEQLVPFVVFARFCGTPTGKRPVQQLDIRDQVLLRPAPVGQFLATGSPHLVAKELDDAVVNPVVVWFNDALAVFVAESKQALFLDRRPDQWIDFRFGFRPHNASTPISEHVSCPATGDLLRQDAPYRCPPDLQPAGDFGFAGASAVQFPDVSGPEPRRLRPAQSFPIQPGLGQASASSLSQNLSFELGEDSQQSVHRTPGWCGQIQSLGEGNETDAEMFQFLEGRQQIRY